MSNDFLTEMIIMPQKYNDTIKFITLFVIQFIGMILGILLLYGHNVCYISTGNCLV